jgi:hypothetical protein
MVAINLRNLNGRTVPLIDASAGRRSIDGRSVADLSRSSNVPLLFACPMFIFICGAALVYSITRLVNRVRVYGAAPYACLLLKRWIRFLSRASLHLPNVYRTTHPKAPLARLIQASAPLRCCRVQICGIQSRRFGTLDDPCTGIRFCL